MDEYYLNAVSLTSPFFVPSTKSGEIKGARRPPMWLHHPDVDFDVLRIVHFKVNIDSHFFD